MRIGIDLGGTKTEIAALGQDGTVLVRRRVATPVGDYDAIVAMVRDLVNGVERETGSHGTVGIGIPGTLSPATGVVKNANSTCLNGRRLDADLGRALGRDVRLANDANCFALSEATDGAAAGAATVFGVILGTGVGGGVVLGGRLLVGADAIAGEWGHVPLPWPDEAERAGPPCWCGRRGCIETFLSGPALARDGDGVTAEEVVARADSGDPAAEAALARYEHRLARALAMIINILDPEMIVLGGGLGRVARLYRTVPPLWRGPVFSDAVAARLVPPVWGDSSGVRGAAWLWRPDEAP
jgi:fructokinase